MPRVKLTNESDTDLILAPASPETPPQDVKSKPEDVEAGYVVENFDYRVFSENTSSIPPKAHFTETEHSNRKLWSSFQQFLYRVRGTSSVKNLQSLPQWFACSRSWLLTLIIIILLFLVVLIGIQLGKLRHEHWLIQHQCVSGLCLTSAGALHSKLNRSVSPCANFYQFACGKHSLPMNKMSQPDAPTAQGINLYRSKMDQMMSVDFNRENSGKLIRIHRPAIDHLAEINMHALIMGLRKVYYSYPHKTSSAKFKVAQWFASCTNRYFRNWVGIRRFLKTALISLGGMWLMDRQATNETGAGDENSTSGWPSTLFYSRTLTERLPLFSNWSWMGAIQRLHADLHVPVFVDFSLTQDPDQTMQIHFYPEQTVYTGGRHSSYTKQYIIRLLRLLAIEARIAISDQEITNRINLAAEDFLTISDQLYTLYRKSGNRRTTLSLGELNSQSSDFDWKGLLSKYFNEVGYTFSDSYQIRTNYPDYMKGISPLIAELKKNYTQAILNRMLNNYMLCNTLDSFAWHLSYDFASLSKDRAYREDTSLELDCLTMLHQLFPSVLEAIFVEHHLNEEAVNHTLKLLDHIKTAAHEQIDQTVWLDDTSKKGIEERIDKLKIKFILPESVTNEVKLNYAFRKLKSSYIYVENIISAVQYIRSAYNRIFAGIPDPIEADWLKKSTYVYDTKVGIDVVADVLYMPLGALQPPVYHYTLPQPLNFAGLGSMLGSAISQLIGYLGSYRIKGPYEQLWTENSWKEYLKHVDCVHYKLGNDTALHFNLSSWMAEYVLRRISDEAVGIINEATGVRIALKALSRWVSEVMQGVENTTLPGKHFDKDMLFFLTYAQTFCDPRADEYSFYELYFGTEKIPREVVLNHILAELPDFAKVFNCPVGSKMNPKDQCSAVL